MFENPFKQQPAKPEQPEESIDVDVSEFDEENSIKPPEDNGEEMKVIHSIERRMSPKEEMREMADYIEKMQMDLDELEKNASSWRDRQKIEFMQGELLKFKETGIESFGII